MVAKPRRGRPARTASLSTINHPPPSFFKIFLPEHNSKRLLIPPDFIKNFNDIIPETARIKDLQGKLWNVGLKKVGARLFMVNGWEDFVSDHSLDRGDFLLFTYTGNSMFSVKIFGLSGCVKKQRVEVAKGCSIDQVKEREKLAEQVKNGDSNPESPAEISGRSQGIPETTETELSEEAAQSSNLQFAKTVTKDTRYLCLPPRVLRECNEELPESITLRNEKGESHNMTIHQWHDRVTLGGGFEDFLRTNNIQRGDVCAFEVILGKDRIIKEVLVKVSM